MARGIGHLEWESSRDEKYAEKWWADHGFAWTLKKRFVSYSTYEVSKDGTTVNYDIPNNSRMDIKKFMEGPAGFVAFYEQRVLLDELRKQVRESQQ